VDFDLCELAVGARPAAEAGEPPSERMTDSSWRVLVPAYAGETARAREPPTVRMRMRAFIWASFDLGIARRDP
jgi:hypothetical protein